MDISKQPIKADLNLSSKLDSSIAQKRIITDIRDLKLEVGKVYTASVIQAKDVSQAQPATANQAQQPSKEPRPTDAKTKALTSNEWLILVKGKIALISSEKPLEIGQKLLLKLAESTTANKPALIAQLTTTKHSPTNQTPNQALQTSQTSSTIQASQSQQTLATQLDATSIKVLLQALNLTLDKQLPLQQGFQQLNTLINQTQPASLNPEQQKIIETIKATLINKLPTLNELSSNIPQSTQPTSNPVKQSLLDSGIFLEKSLLTQPEKLIAFKQRLASIDTLLPLNRAASKSESAATSLTNMVKTTNIANPANTSSNSAASPMLQHQSAAIQKIQQTINHLLQLASNGTAVNPTLKTSDSSPTIPTANDLKGNLLTISSLLTKQLAAELSDAQLKSIFLGGSSEPYSVSPFAFPMLTATSPSANAKALFDKQTFSTGQILKLLAGMIHKLQFNQLHSLLHSSTNTENPTQQTWFFEIPVLNTNQTIETFNFRIDKEPQNTQEDENRESDQKFQWKLLLSFDLDTLGPVYVLVKLTQNRISSELWADKESTYSLLQKESAHFKAQLEKIGLTVSEVLCKQGQPSQIKTKLDRHLVDTKV